MAALGNSGWSVLIGFTRPFGPSLFSSTRGTGSFHHSSQKCENDVSIGPIMPPSSVRPGRSGSIQQRQVRRHQNTTPRRPVSENAEQPLHAAPVHRHIAWLVADQQVGPVQMVQDSVQRVLLLFFLQPGDQLRRHEEPDFSLGKSTEVTPKERHERQRFKLAQDRHTRGEPILEFRLGTLPIASGGTGFDT